MHLCNIQYLSLVVEVNWIPTLEHPWWNICILKLQLGLRIHHMLKVGRTNPLSSRFASRKDRCNMTEILQSSYEGSQFCRRQNLHAGRTGAAWGKSTVQLWGSAGLSGCFVAGFTTSPTSIPNSGLWSKTSSSIPIVANIFRIPACLFPHFIPGRRGRWIDYPSLLKHNNLFCFSLSRHTTGYYGIQNGPGGQIAEIRNRQIRNRKIRIPTIPLILFLPPQQHIQWLYNF